VRSIEFDALLSCHFFAMPSPARASVAAHAAFILRKHQGINRTNLRGDTIATLLMRRHSRLFVLEVPADTS
jgi:hypothetical protein